MRKGKKIIALALITVLALSSLTACGKKNKDNNKEVTTDDTATTDDTTATDDAAATDDTAAEETVSLGDATLKVWGPQEQQDAIQAMCEDFKALHPDDNIQIEFGVVSEADAKNEVLKDPSVAADVFTFASDQIAELVQAGTLFPIKMNTDQIIANNTENSIAASTVGGELYAYPSSSDTYFMYYDKSKYTEDEIKSLDTMLAKDLGSGVTNFSYDIDNGWYLSAFFFGAGCTLFGPDGTDATQCDFNNDRGLLVGEYLMNLAKNPKFANHDDGLLLAAFEAGTLGANVTGTWNAAAIKESLGDNFGTAPLPTVTLSNGETIQLGGMANFKLYGVNSQTKNPQAAMALAEYLTSEACQKTRFEQFSYGPTNLNLANDTAAMSSNQALAAMTQQIEFATLQTSIPQTGNYWSPAEAFGTGLMDGSITADNLQSKLDDLVNNILATLN
ncbi:MAG TPA: maltose-binding protein [Lachnospiraceae bacterium]|uniref:extracellular solute-binding protein n=1 Tax=Anaerosporobacter sp. TaxID=1872529 RepID=UPI000EE450E0|nr:extracellular solute-binding protein [Anaerosporobacter sp.]HAB61676.1 maltose-binding protein [Lachnospiraceae bacterium]